MSRLQRRLLKLEEKMAPRDAFSRFEDVVHARHAGIQIPWGTTPYLRRLEATLRRRIEKGAADGK